MGSTQTSTSTMRNNGERGGEAHLPVGEGQPIDLEAGDGGLDARASARGDIDDVEAGEGGDDRDGDADAQFLPQPRQGDVDELLPRPAPSSRAAS